MKWFWWSPEVAINVFHCISFQVHTLLILLIGWCRHFVIIFSYQAHIFWYGPVLFGNYICSNVETILSWTCHVYGPFEFRTSLGTSILLDTSISIQSSNIPSSPAYGVFISQLIWNTRACSSYECFILRAAWLSLKLLGQGYIMERLKSSFRKCYGRYGDLIKHYEVFLS